MFWFLLFAGVAVVWTVVLALLGLRLWRRAKALFRELSAAQDKLDAAALSSGATGPHHGRHASAGA